MSVRQISSLCILVPSVELQHSISTSFPDLRRVELDARALLLSSEWVSTVVIHYQ